MSLFANFQVGDQVTAVADFHDHQKQKTCTVLLVNDLGILVRDTTGIEQWFDRDAGYTCPYSHKRTMWLEKGA